MRVKVRQTFEIFVKLTVFIKSKTKNLSNVYIFFTLLCDSGNEIYTKLKHFIRLKNIHQVIGLHEITKSVWITVDAFYIIRNEHLKIYLNRKTARTVNGRLIEFGFGKR